MSELLQAAKAVIDRWDAHHVVVDGTLIADLRAAVERAESDKVDKNDDLFAVCMYGVRTERERIRARAKLAAEKTWKTGDWFVGPQHNNIEAFVKELLEDINDSERR